MPLSPPVSRSVLQGKKHDPHRPSRSSRADRRRYHSQLRFLFPHPRRLALPILDL
ncbi:major facilitator superfamily MFS_1 [Rhizobium etli CNPAF512]|nr:major facilitator superfamily MFS_1 [Rhizobium etli CNPAF512]